MKTSYLKIVYTDTYISLAKNMKIEKDELLTLSGVKRDIGENESPKSQVTSFCTTCKLDLVDLL